MNRNRSFPVPHRRPVAQVRVATKGRQTTSANWTFFTMATLAGAAALAITLLSGCNGGEKTFAKVNGQVITQDEYLHQLERQQVPINQGQAYTAERMVIDQIVGNRLIIQEASKNNVLPTDDDVNKMFETQKKLVMAQVPGKDYETLLKEQGNSPEGVKTDLRYQLAETNLYFKLLKIDEAEVRSTYDNMRDAYSLPPRVQMRLIVASPKAPEYAQIQKALASGQAFDKVAKELNAPQLRPNGGLVPQTTNIAQLPPAWQAKATATADGNYFGPVDFQQGLKAWVKLEKKLPEFKLPYEDAAPLVRGRLVRVKLSIPANLQVRNDLLKKKFQSTFTSEDKSYEAVWNALKDEGTKGMLAQPGAGAAPATGAPVPGGAVAPK